MLQACVRAESMNIAGFSVAAVDVVSGFLDDNNQQFDSQIEAIEL